MSDKKQPVAAYMPFKTLLSSLDHLRAHGIPNKIDRSFFPHHSGTVQGMIISGFRFLGLIDEEGKPTETLDALVHDEDNRKANLAAVLKRSYPNLFQADLERITPQHFDSLFSSEIYNVQGDTRSKARAFFFFALQYAEIPHSKLLTKRSKTPRNRSHKKKAGASESATAAVAAKTNKDSGGGSRNDSHVNDQAKKSLQLTESKKTVWLGTDANLLEIKFGRDLDFMLAVMKLFDLYENGASGFSVNAKEEDKGQK